MRPAGFGFQRVWDPPGAGFNAFGTLRVWVSNCLKPVGSGFQTKWPVFGGLPGYPGYPGSRVRALAPKQLGCGTHMWDADVAGFGNRQPHLPNVERNRPPQNTFLLSRGIYRPPSNNPTRDTEVTCSAHLQTYGSVFFVLCSLYFIVFCIVIVRFRRFSLY